MKADLVSINGEFYKPEDAKISVFDRGFLFGDAVYEVTRSYGRILFKIEAHVDRLFRSAASINMDIEKSPEDVIQELYRVYKAVNQDDKYVRWQVTRGQGVIGMASDLTPHCNWVIYVKDVDKISSEQYAKGVRVATTSRLRNTKQALDPNIKSGNYLNNVLAFQDAMKKKSFECVMIDSRGHITEGTTSNIFCVRDGVVLTPPSKSDILVGITRTCLFEIAEEIGLEMHEADLTPEDFYSADEVFLTSSTREVLPVSHVDATAIKSHGMGPITKKLALAYKDMVNDYCERAKKEHPWK